MTLRPAAFPPFGLLRRGRLLLAAGALALAGVAAPALPARAQTSQEVLAFLLGATTVAVIVRAATSEARPSQRLGRGTLPDACRETVRLHGRHVELYHAGCLGWYGLGRLPQRCELPLRTNVGTRRYFLAQCLFEANYHSQGGWGRNLPVWDSPGFVTRPHLPPRAVPPRHHHGHGHWRDRDRDRDRGRDHGWHGGDRDRDRGDGRPGRGGRDRAGDGSGGPWAGRGRGESPGQWSGRRDGERDGARDWRGGQRGAQGQGSGEVVGPVPADHEWTNRGP